MQRWKDGGHYLHLLSTGFANKTLVRFIKSLLKFYTLVKILRST